jgi:hypothetical protein
VSELNANPASGWQGTLDNLLRAGQAYLTLEQQRNLQAVNLQRAAQGLAPLDVSQYGMGVNVGLSQETQNTIKTAVISFAVVYLLGKIFKK